MSRQFNQQDDENGWIEFYWLQMFEMVDSIFFNVLKHVISNDMEIKEKLSYLKIK